MLRTVVALLLLSASASAQDALPAEVERALTDRYGTWRLPVDDDLRSEYVRSSDRIEPGDYDGDGRLDYAVLVIHPTRPRPWLTEAEAAGLPDEEWSVVVLLAREDGHVAHEFRFDGYLGSWAKAEAGEEVRVVHSGPTFTLEADGIHIGFEEKSSSLYFYYGGAFISASTGD